MKFPKTIRDWWSENTELMFRFKGTVAMKIWPQVLFGILFSAIITSIHFYVPGMKMDFPLTIVSLLGFVISLLLVFRTNTAYDRYYEGRRIWSTMTQAIRVLTKTFWLGVKDATGTSKDVIEKTTAINLLVAFAYAIKNYLREEYSYEADGELKQLMAHIPKFQKFNKFQTPKNGKKLNSSEISIEMETEDKKDISSSSTININSENKCKRSLPKTMSSRRRSAFRVRDSSTESFTRRDFMYMAHDYIKPTNIPLELAYYIDSYNYQFFRKGIVDTDTFKVMLAATNSLVDSLTQFERVLRTPIPLAYSVHLHHAVWLYLISLPFQLVGTLGYVTIPVIGLVTFALQGVLAIGSEIENPFGLDDNDLPLDDFCDVIRQEAEMIMSHQIPETESWTFTNENRPFFPKSFESAQQLNDKSIEDVRRILATGSPFHCYMSK